MITCGFVSMVQSGGERSVKGQGEWVDPSRPSHILGEYVYLRVAAVDADNGVSPVGRWRHGDVVLDMYPIEEVGDAST